MVGNYMNWISLINSLQVEEIKQKSYQRPQVIFKHSTRCSISSTVLNRLKRFVIPDNTDFYYLDLIAHKDISLKIATDFQVPHQSPQILIIKDGEAVYDESHMAITADKIEEIVS